MLKFLKKEYRDLHVCVFLFFISIFFVFYQIGDKALFDWDEGIYSNIAGAVVEQNHWGTFSLQGTAWYEKEPFGFWLMSLSLKVFGNTVFALRFPAAIFSLFIAPAFFLLARRFFERYLAVFLTLLFFFSPVLWHSHMLRTADLDALSLSLSLLSFVAYLYLRDKKYWYITAVLLSLGLLTRGVLGFVPVFVVLFAEFARPFFKKDRWKYSELALFLLISCAPWVLWHVYQWNIAGDAYVNVYWKEQFFQRVSTGLQGHSGSIWYYGDFLKKKLGIEYIVLFLLGSSATSWSLYKTKDWNYLFLLLWLAATVFPPHVLSTKLYWYILPVMPSLYLTLGSIFVSVKHFFKSRFIYVVCLLILSFSLLSHISERWNAFRAIQESELLHMVDRVKIYFPEASPLVLREVGVWNFGRTLPALYWYLHSEQHHEIFLIDEVSTIRYIDNIEQFPWWIVSPEVFETLKTQFPQISIEKIDAGTSYVLLHITR